MLVPLRIFVAESLAIPTLRTFTPGAKMSTALPKLEKEALVSDVLVSAPTVIASGADAGESFRASCYTGQLRISSAL